MIGTVPCAFDQNTLPSMQSFRIHARTVIHLCTISSVCVIYLSTVAQRNTRKTWYMRQIICPLGCDILCQRGYHKDTYSSNDMKSSGNGRKVCPSIFAEISASFLYLPRNCLNKVKERVHIVTTCFLQLSKFSAISVLIT